MKPKFTFKTYLKILAVCGLWWITPIFASTAPHVVVSIAPFHALVSAVMGDVGTPELLVKPGASPHHYNLRPSEIKSLQEANLIFWGGPDLETFLVKPLKSLEGPKEIVELDKTTKLLLLSPRRTAAFEHPAEHHHKPGEQAHKHEHKHEDEGQTCCGHGEGTDIKDMHFWLDPNNAKLMVATILDRLSTIDPEHQKQYQENAKKFMVKLEALDRELKIKLKPIKKMPYVVFHDAYQYFEHHYGLTGVGAIAIHPELPLSLQRLYEIRERIKKTKAICVFREPQFKSQLVNNLSQDTGARVGELDPLGQSHAKDGSDYLHLLDNIANSLRGCLLEESTKQPDDKK